MIDFKNIKDHVIDRPNNWSCIGSSEDFDSLSEEFKDQIKFLDKEASDFLYNYFNASQFHTGPLWEPFKKMNFKYAERISTTGDKNLIKKWLYNRGIAFSKWVYILPNYGNESLMITWKMVIKNSENLFSTDDVVVFDESNQWCLSYWHEDEMFFGKINCKI